MAEIWQLNDHNSSSITARDPILVSTLWFSRSRNPMTSSELTLDYQKNEMWPIWRKYDNLNDHNLSYMTGRDLLLVSTLWLYRSTNSMASSDLILDYQKTRWRSICWKFCIQMVISRVRCLIISKIVLSKSFLHDILSQRFVTSFCLKLSPLPVDRHHFM